MIFKTLSSSIAKLIGNLAVATYALSLKLICLVFNRVSNPAVVESCYHEAQILLNTFEELAAMSLTQLWSWISAWVGRLSKSLGVDYMKVSEFSEAILRGHVALSRLQSASNPALQYVGIEGIRREIDKVMQALKRAEEGAKINAALVCRKRKEYERCYFDLIKRLGHPDFKTPWVIELNFERFDPFPLKSYSLSM